MKKKLTKISWRFEVDGEIYGEDVNLNKRESNITMKGVSELTKMVQIISTRDIQILLFSEDEDDVELRNILEGKTVK